MPQKKTGVYDQQGKDAHSKNANSAFHKIDEIFNQAEDKFHSVAAETGLEIARGMVPIDTHTLQKHIQAFREGKATIIQVPDATLSYPDKPTRRSALAIALILEAGYYRGPKALQRTKSNILPGTEQGSPTKGWFSAAGRQMQKTIQPIAANILQAAITEALNEINGSI